MYEPSRSSVNNSLLTRRCQCRLCRSERPGRPAEFADELGVRGPGAGRPVRVVAAQDPAAGVAAGSLDDDARPCRPRRSGLSAASVGGDPSGSSSGPPRPRRSDQDQPCEPPLGAPRPFSRLRLAEGGSISTYYPLNEEGQQREYEQWRRGQAGVLRQRLGNGRADLPLHARRGRRAVDPRRASQQQPGARRRIDPERERRAGGGARAPGGEAHAGSLNLLLGG